MRTLNYTGLYRGMALNLETIKLVFEAVYFLHPHLVATCFVLSCLSSYWITTSDMNMFSDALKIIIKTNLNVPSE